MDIFDLSPKGKKRFVKWMGKRHRELCISELIRNVPDERTLFKMCRYIDKWYDQHEPSMEPLETSMEPLETSMEPTEEMYQDSGQQEDQEEVAPDVAPIVKQEAPVFEQKVLSTKVKGRLNEFVLHHPEVCISEIIRNTDDEAEILRTIEEIESRVIPVDIRVRLWTVRQAV